jgi:hypothetical protein
VKPVERLGYGSDSDTRADRPAGGEDERRVLRGGEI